MSAVNPYAAPAAHVEDQDTEEERIRREHINHESSIKSVGILYYLGGVLVMFGGLSMMASTAREPAGAIFILLLLVAIGVGQLFAGYGVRALRPWGRVIGTVMSVPGLLGFPIGTLINAYILYLFWSKKGKTVFSPEYQQVIAATPHVKYTTSILVWIVIALILAFVVITVGVLMIDGKS